MTAETRNVGAKVLETDRLVLRKLTTDDAPFMLALLNEPLFVQHVADRGLRTNDDATRYISEKILPSYDTFGFGFWLVELKESGAPIGTCGLAKRDNVEHVDIGYAFIAGVAGNGYAYESAAAVMNYARTVLKLDRVIGLTSESNQRSQKVLEKLGLRHEKTIELPGYNSPSMVFA